MLLSSTIIKMISGMLTIAAVSTLLKNQRIHLPEILHQGLTPNQIRVP